MDMNVILLMFHVWTSQRSTVEHSTIYCALFYFILLFFTLLHRTLLTVLFKLVKHTSMVGTDLVQSCPSVDVNYVDYFNFSKQEIALRFLHIALLNTFLENNILLL